MSDDSYSTKVGDMEEGLQTDNSLDETQEIVEGNSSKPCGPGISNVLGNADEKSISNEDKQDTMEEEVCPICLEPFSELSRESLLQYLFFKYRMIDSCSSII
jgi:hypothetical protein